MPFDLNPPGFLLPDDWQAAQVASAYAAAQAFSNDFRLFISFDMTVFPCSSASDGSAILALATKYANHPNQATYQDTGRPIVSTFAGSDCTFGRAGWDAGFDAALRQPLKSATGLDMFFIPSVFTDPSVFSSVDVMDGELNWNSGWPTGQEDISFARDETYLAQLGSKAYMAAVSPWYACSASPSVDSSCFSLISSSRCPTSLLVIPY